jgi:hypothetical protein
MLYVALELSNNTKKVTRGDGAKRTGGNADYSRRSLPSMPDWPIR